MNGIQHLDIRDVVRNAADRPEDGPHRLAEVLPAVGRQQDQAAPLGPVQHGVPKIGPHGGLEGIDGRIAGDVDVLRLFALPQKVLLGLFRRRKVIARDDAHSLTVELLGPRRV